jgi:choline dehydrogenase
MSPSYDYIIVGAGAAGCVLAYRLTEDRACNVLLLEAGGRDWHPLLKLPIAWTTAMVTPQFNWGFESEPDAHRGGRSLPLARGKMLGGSTSINGMRYSRGHFRDYDQWRQLGNKGWGFADVLPYFKRSERNYRGENKYHGGDGPLNVRLGRNPALLYEPLRDAAKSAGIPETEDMHGDEPEGIAPAEMTIDRFGRRHSTAKAFLKPAMKRKNLTVVMHALASKVRIENGRAIGVEYLHKGRPAYAMATREVILSGGAYNSPQLLMLSGIGPANQLRKHNIPVLVDLPGVGKNLAEHPLISVQAETNEPIALLRHLRMDRATKLAAQWFFTGTGLFGLNANSAGLFTRTRPELERHDVQLLYSAIARDAKLWWPGGIGNQKYIIQCSISLQHPEALGELTLRSADPADKPRININLFGSQADVDTTIRGIRLARKIFEQAPLKSLIKGELMPGKDVRSDEALRDFIWAYGATTQHPCGTCKMGNDSMAVVDDELRVRGVQALRVIDASIMPTIPGGHINAPTIMIGEKGADLVRGRPALEAAVL